MTEARPVAVWTGPSVPALNPKSLPYETDEGSHRKKKEKKKCSKLNSAAARESQTWPGKKKGKKEKKKKEKLLKDAKFLQERGREKTDV